MSGFSFLAKESAILIYAGILGLEMGLMYDFLRIIRKVWSCSFAFVALMDLGFWGFVAYRTFSVMHTYSNGTLRWFSVLGALVVLGIYRNLIGRYFVAAGVFVLSRLRNIWIKGKKSLTKFLKLSIIKVRKNVRKGEKHGKKSSVSDQIS